MGRSKVCGSSVSCVLTWFEVPWFPRRPSDIDHFSQATLDAGADLESDHPGFNVGSSLFFLMVQDPVYRERRAMITNNAKAYKQFEFFQLCV